MTKLFSFLLAFFCGIAAGLSQVKMPVKFSYSSKKISDCEYELVFTADIEPTWHLYSQVPTDDGPLPTVFNFEPSKGYKLKGKTTEPKPIEMAEPVFDNAVVRYFEKQAVFRQKVTLLTDGAVTIKGTIEGMTCNESQCIPFSPPFDFEFTLNGTDQCKDQKGGVNLKEYKPGDTSGCVCDTAAILKLSGLNAERSDTLSGDISGNVTEGSQGTLSNAPGEIDENSSWFAIFITGFLGGFAALLTPCVFPMIPMTVSFFTKRSKTKAKGISNALIYSVSIVAIYVSLGLIVTFSFGSDALNALSTNVWFNLFFFALLVVFAVSFLGAFEITLPSSFVNKVDSASDRGGLIGIFFMAFTLSLVSFSCTGPIIGTLLVRAASLGEISGPFWGMFGFALALALPFGLFAAFPGWLNSLPKSGGWLNSVKVFLGFLELALAFKFLSNADLVVQAGLITREVFLVLWIVIFGLLGIYLMGWFKLSHDSDVKHLSVGRLMIAILTLSFTVYLIPGLWGAPLKLISGFPPPQFYSEMPNGFSGGGGGGDGHASLPKHAHAGPHGILTFDNYDHALEYAREVKKPLMLDFTGWACVNCRKMEEQVWSDPKVKEMLSQDVVLVSLYVDDKRELPAEEQVEVDWNGKRKLKTIGNKWSYLQATKYKSNAQPQYWIVDYEGNPVHEYASYDPNIEKYIDWIERGVAAFKKKYP
ncbi:MAG: cytochrome c biogenesis protein CcdA [Bacteroidota bacterium]